MTPRGIDRGVASIDFAVQAGVGEAELPHRRGRGFQADHVGDQIRGGVVRVGDHQADRVAE